MSGGFLKATFVASSDGHGGTIVEATAGKRGVVSPHGFIAAIASIGALSGGGLWTAGPSPARATMLLAPRTSVA